MRVRVGLLAVAAVWCGVMLHRGEPLAWDEVEFARATRWIAEGRVPFRDFWEHHTPLQWLLFAPVARLFSGGAGTIAVVALRWAQVPLWIAIFAIAAVLGRRAEVDPWGRWCALACVLASPWFVRAALQYRVDVAGNLAYLAALLLIAFAPSRRWTSFAAGALMGAAVLSNMRLAPLVVVTTVIALVWQRAERRWSWNAQALFIVAGGATTAVLFILYLQLAGAMPGFLDGVVWYNRASGALVPREARNFIGRLIAPLLARDIGAMLFFVFAAIGLVIALRELRRPGALQIMALLAVASLITIAVMKVHYQYHYQTPLLLLMPIAGVAFDRVRLPLWRNVIAAAIAVALALNLAPLATSSFGAALQYQNRVMLETDARTRPGDRVWGGCGYALRREPAYRYWFLPAGVRLLADARQIEPYDLEQMAARPPAAIVYDLRTRFWMIANPRLRTYAMHHYVPLYQQLWIPGLNALLEAGRSRTTWVVPASGHYDVKISAMLASHPWFSRPLDYGVMEGTDLEIPLNRIDTAAADAIEWRVNGVPVTLRDGMLDLRAGTRLELLSSLPRRAAVVIVPHGVTTLSIMPDVPMVF